MFFRKKLELEIKEIKDVLTAPEEGYKYLGGEIDLLDNKIIEQNNNFLKRDEVVACHTCGALVEKIVAESIIVSDNKLPSPWRSFMGIDFSYNCAFVPVIVGNIKSEDEEYRYYCKIHKPKGVDRIVNGKEVKFAKKTKKTPKR